MGGWQLEPFNGSFYPPGSQKGFRKLEYYSHYFDVVEVNATFYTNTLTRSNAHQWLQDVSGNEDFKFSVKLFRAFTHSMDAKQGDVKSVHRLLEPLAGEGKLVGLVMQFPYSFVSNEANRAYLVKLGKAFSQVRCFVEVRHNSWNSPEMMDFFHENGLHLVNVDLPKFKKHMPLTGIARGDCAYFRLMGRNAKDWDRGLAGAVKRTASESGRYLYRYSEQELREIAEVVRTSAMSVADTVVVFHNDPNGYSLLNGYQFRHLLKHDKTMNVPERLLTMYPELEDFTSQEHLPAFPTEATNG